MERFVYFSKIFENNQFLTPFSFRFFAVAFPSSSRVSAMSEPENSVPGPRTQALYDAPTQVSPSKECPQNKAPEGPDAGNGEVAPEAPHAGKPVVVPEAPAAGKGKCILLDRACDYEENKAKIREEAERRSRARKLAAERDKAEAKKARLQAQVDRRVKAREAWNKLHEPPNNRK